MRGLKMNSINMLNSLRGLSEGASLEIAGQTVVNLQGVLRSRDLVSQAQAQTRETFGYKWARRETFEGRQEHNAREWLIARYGNVAAAEWLFETSDRPVLLDAGCGAGFTALALFAPILGQLQYVGVDISTAVDVAKQRFAERGFDGTFIQSDINRIPLPDQSVDLVYSEGVLHHTDDTRAALTAVVRLLKTGGRILFYVYRKKGPVREFTDDYIREQLQGLPPEQAWALLEPLTQLGKALGDLNKEIEVPESVSLLGIPAGRINIQRLFYWHVMKMYYRPELSMEEMNHINFDWYAPKNAHRQTEHEVRKWCAELGLLIERDHVEEAGITIIARRQ